jgi:YVTN family beta-propeller protein
VVATIPVGSQPNAIAYDSVNNQVYVANYGSKSISVISDITHTVIAIVALEKQPQAIGYNSGEDKLFVAYSEAHIVSVIKVSALPLPSASIPEYQVDTPPAPEYPVLIIVSFALASIALTTVLYRRKPQSSGSM